MRRIGCGRCELHDQRGIRSRLGGSRDGDAERQCRQRCADGGISGTGTVSTVTSSKGGGGALDAISVLSLLTMVGLRQRALRRLGGARHRRESGLADG